MTALSCFDPVRFVHENETRTEFLAYFNVAQDFLDDMA